MVHEPDLKSSDYIAEQDSKEKNRVQFRVLRSYTRPPSLIPFKGKRGGLTYGLVRDDVPKNTHFVPKQAEKMQKPSQ